MDEKKMAQDKWIAAVIWGVLAAGLIYSSNAMIDIFNNLISAVFTRLGAGVGGLFADLPSVFVFLLALILLLALLNALLGSWGRKGGFYTPSAMEIPVYLILMIIPVGSLFLLAQFIRRTVINVAELLIEPAATKEKA